MERSRKRRRLQNGEEKLGGDESDLELVEPGLRLPAGAKEDSSSTADEEEEACTASNNKEERTDESEDEDDDDQSQSSSYISEPADSADEDAVRDRYLQRKLVVPKKKAEEFDKKQEAVVQQAYSHLEEELKKGKSIPIGPIEGGSWNLYSTEYFSHYFVEVHSGKWLSFGELRNDLKDALKWACEPGQIYAQLHIYPDGHLDTYPFDPPLQAALEPIMVKSLLNCDIELIFLGNGYLKLRVGLEVLINEKASLHHIHEPKMIEFSGIWISDEERRRLRASFRAPKPPPPKDSMASRLCGWDSD